MDSNASLQHGGLKESSISEGGGYPDNREEASSNLPNDNDAEEKSLSLDGVEAEANSYCHQLFRGRLTVDAFVEKLARLKESSVEREQSIYENILANILEEYRFFPKYPEKQLKITAVLFGSIIKHRFVTHLTLGIALRAVLDAVCKPSDSKMFMFGTKALEQFVDRLTKWPQYCHHILEISYLHVAQPELVASIERALASSNLNSSRSNNREAGNSLSIGVNDNHEARNRAEGLNSQRSTSLERFFLIANFIAEILSAVFDQLSSAHKPQYALFSMLISYTMTLISIVALIRVGRKERVTWKWRPIPWFYDRVLGIIGLACAIFQCIFTTIAYAFLSRSADNPINISVWPIIFAFGLLWSRF